MHIIYIFKCILNSYNNAPRLKYFLYLNKYNLNNKNIITSCNINASKYNVLQFSSTFLPPHHSIHRIIKFYEFPSLYIKRERENKICKIISFMYFILFLSSTRAV